MAYDIAVLSDLHCHPIGKVQASFLLTNMLATPRKRHPAYALVDLIKQDGLRADVVVVLGDLTDKINAQGLISGRNYIAEIAKALESKITIYTLGNHDVNSRRIKNASDPFELAKGVHEDYPVKTEEQKDMFWLKGYCIITQGDLRILNLNSVHSHTNEVDAKRGLISTEQLESLRKSLSETECKKHQIAIAHHHPMPHEGHDLGSEDLMMNGSLLLELLAEYKYQLFVHGHKHYPRLSYAAGGNDSLPVFAAGSFAACSANMLAITRNLFHIVTLEEKMVKKCRAQGMVRSWEFRPNEGWVYAIAGAASIPYKTGFGFRGSINEIAKKCECILNKGNKDIIEWENVVKLVPQLNYMIPGDLVQLGKVLRTYQISLEPNPPDRPKLMGRFQGGCSE